MPVDPATIEQIAVTADRTALYALVAIVVQGVVAAIIAYFGLRMKQLERNTNSMREQLVAATAALNLARGRLEGRADLEAELREHS